MRTDLIDTAENIHKEKTFNFIQQLHILIPILLNIYGMEVNSTFFLLS